MFILLLKILSVAVCVTFLISWGYVKQQRKNQELLARLHKNIEAKILKEFSGKEVLTVQEIEDLLTGVTASLFWSTKKIKVTDPGVVANNVLEDLKHKGMIEMYGHGQYKLK